MATETQIPDLLDSKKVEREDDVLSSEILEEKVLELSGNKVKQVERGSQVAETVNTELETGVPTNESETFFQALSVPTVTPDEGTPESCKAATTEDQEEIKTTTKTEDFTVAKPTDDESVQFVASEEDLENNSDDFQEANEQFENEAKEEEEQETEESVNNIEINEKTTRILSGDEDQERKQEGNTLEKDKSEDVVTSLHDKTFQGDLQGKKLYSEGNEPEVVETKESIGEDTEEKPINILKEEVEERTIDTQEEKGEQNPEESVKESCLKIKQEEDNEEIKPSVETEEKTEQQGFQIESAEHEVISDEGQKESFDHPSVKEVCEEAGSEKVEYKEEVKGTTNENEIVTKVEEEEKEQEVYVSEKDQGGGDDVLTSQDGKFEDIKEATIGKHDTTVAYFEEGQVLNSMSKELLKEEEEDKSSDAQEASKQYEGEGKELEFVKSKEGIEEDTEEIKSSVETKEIEEVIVNDDGQTNKSESPLVKEEEEDKSTDAQEDIREEKHEEGVKNIEQEEDTEEIKPSVETEEQGLLHAVTIDASQTKSHVESVEGDVEGDKAIQSDDGQKEIFDSLSVKEVCEETNTEKVEYKEEVKETTNEDEIVSKTEDEEKEQEVYVSGKDQGDGDDVTSSQDATTEEKEHELKLSEEVHGGEDDVISSQHESAMTKEILKEEDEDKSTNAQEDKREEEQEESVNEIKKSCLEIEQEEETKEIKPSVETKEIEEKIDEEAIVKDDGQTEMSESPLVKEAYEEIGSENVESEEGPKYVESSSKTLNEDEIVSKEENREKEQNLEEDVIESKEIKPSVEADEKDQVKITGNEEDVIESDDGQKEIKEVSEETHSEKVGYEGVGLSKKDEDQEKEQEHIISEASQGKDDVTCSQDATSIEDLTEKKYNSEGKEPEFIKPRESIEEDIEEIKSSVETKEIGEEATVNDDGQTNKTESTLNKEVCEVTSSENVDSEEGLKYVESSSKTLNEDEIVGKEENQEKEKEPEEVQGGDDDVISSQIASSEDIKETTIDQHTSTVAYFGEAEDKSTGAQEASEKCDDGAKDEREEKTDENVNKSVETYMEIEQEEDTEEIKPSVDTEEKTEQQVLLHAAILDDDITAQTESKVKSDDGQKKIVDNPSVNEVCEETSSEKVEYKEEVNETTNEKEIASKVEEEEKENEVNVSEKGEVGGDDVTTSKDETYEDIKEATTDQHVTTVAYFEEKDILKEEEEDKSSDAQEASEQYESGANDKIEQKSEESVNKVENTEEIKPSVETGERVQVKITSNEEDVIETDDGLKENSDNLSIKEVHEETHSEKVEYEGVELSKKDEEQEKEQEQEEDIATYSQWAFGLLRRPMKRLFQSTEEIEEKTDEEAIINDDGQTEKTESPLVKEVCEEIGSENVESEEGLNYFESSSKTLNEDEIVSKEENEEKEQEIKEVQGGGDDVISSSEDIKETTIDQHTTTVAYSGDEEDKSIDAQEASEKCENEATDQIEKNPEESVNEIVQSSSETERTEDIKPSVETNENEEVDTTGNEAGHEEEVFEETHSEKVEISDKDEDQEKKQELIVSEQDQGKDDVTSSQDATSIEDLQEKKYDGEGKEHEIVEPSESIEEDTEETKSSVETKEIEEKIDEEAIVNDDGQTEKTESPLVKEVSDVTSSENVESEEGLKYVESSSKTLNEDEIVSKEKNEEKEQEQEEVQGGGDDVISSHIASNEDIKETTIDQHTTTVASLGTEDKSIDAQEASQKPEDSANKVVESSSEFEDTEEIKPSIETDENEQVNIKGNEAEHEEEVIESDDGRKETSDNLSIKEVCEETHSEKVEFFDKEEDQEKTQEVIVSEQDQGKDEVTSSQDATSIEDLQEKNYDDEGKEREFVKTRESIEEDIEEVKSSVETKENEENIDEEAIVDDDGLTKVSESPLEKEVCEMTRSEKAESEEGLKLDESSSRTLNPDEIVSKEENQEKEQEQDKVQGGGDNVISSQDASSEDIKESQHVTTVVDFEDKKEQKSEESVDQIVESSSELQREEDIEEIKPSVETEQQGLLHALTTNDSIISQTITQGESVEREVKSDDGQKEDVDISSVNEVCEESDSKNVEYIEEVKETINEKEIASKVEEEEKEQEVYVLVKGQGGGDDVTKDATCDDIKETTISAQTESQEENNKESIESDDGQMEKPLIPSVKEVNEETTKEVFDETSLEKVEFEEEVKAIETLKDEDQVDISTEGQSKDNVTSSEVATSEEDLQKRIYQDEGKEPEFVITKESVEEDTSSVETKENEEKIEEEAIVKDDGQTEKSESPLVKEVCEVTGSYKAESELNENEIVSKEEYQEKEQELTKSEEVEGGGDDVITSQNASIEDVKETTIDQHAQEDKQEQKPEEIVNKTVETCSETEKEEDIKEIKPSVTASEEDLEKKKYEDEGKESDFVKTGEIIEEDTEEISSKEESTKIEEKNEESIESDVGQIKDEDQGTNNEEKIEEGGLVNDDGQTDKSEIPLVKKVNEVTGLEKAESELKENETVTKEEIQEKEQGLKMSEEVKGGEDDVISSQNASNEEKSTDVNETTKVEPSISIETSTEETPNAKIENKSLSIKDLESVREVQVPEVVTKSEDPNLKEERLTETYVDEEKETVTKEVSSDEKTEHTTEIKQVEEDSYSTELQEKSTDDQKEIANEISYSDPIPVENTEVTEVKVDAKIEQEDLEVKHDNEDAAILEPQVNFPKIESTDYPSESEESTKQAIESVCDAQIPQVVPSSETTESKQVSEHLSISSRDAVLLEEVSSELGQPKEKIVEEKTVSEVIEDEITKKDENLSNENDTTTKEEKCVQDGRTTEFEPVEEKSTDLSEIREVKPQEDVKKNLELHEELKPTNELVIEEETKVKAESSIELENIQAAKTPIFEFEKKEKDDELLSEIQNPEATLKTELLEETNNTSETLTDELLIEKKLSEPVIPDTATTEDLKISQKDVTDDIKSKVAENLIEERERDLTKYEKVEKEETGEKEAKTDEENEEEDDEDNHNIDAPVMVEASKDIEVKTPKKSHNILSGVGSKVKHSIAKVKKAITGKSSHPKPSSPKEKDQVIT